MKKGLGLMFCLLLLSPFVVAQSACIQGKSEVVEHKFGFTIHSVSLPSTRGALKAKAAIPDTGKPGDATVFSFSTLVGSESQQSVDMNPLALELAKQGRPTMVIERKLTWPEVDQSVGTMQAEVICAEQWLSKHATVRPNHWRFVGPDSDAPKPEQFDELGDKSSMTFWIIFPVGDSGANGNTENLLRNTSEVQKWLLKPFWDE